MSSSRATALLAAAGLLLTGCSEMLLHRSSLDYFPLIRGSEWKYLVGKDTAYYVEVLGDTPVGNATSTAVAVNFLPEFWLKEPTSISRYFYRDTLIGSYPDVLEERYGLVYLLPFVSGNSWQDSFSQTLYGLDTFDYHRRLEARVSGPEDVPVPAGVFHDCYRIEFTEQTGGSDTTTVFSSEWLAPGVGLVKKVIGTETRELADYHIGPLTE
ncbi:MAG: hypothetical protein JSU73_05525 [candidate division WOR-3 bacterium]|nr:MAG: hypothetical protein JSU73_05525 [candidate division WOR-3 bacterium]